MVQRKYMLQSPHDNPPPFELLAKQHLYSDDSPSSLKLKPRSVLPWGPSHHEIMDPKLNPQGNRM